MCYHITMKKFSLILITLILLSPFMAFGAYDRDLYFGVTGNDVAELQQFLTDQGMYSGPTNGNFFSLTQGGVKHFQEREGISPAAGYFGPITRARANTFVTPISREEQIAALQAQIAALTAQVAELTAKVTPTTSPVVVIPPPPPPIEPPPASPAPVPPPPPPPPPPPAAVLEVKGSNELTFPESEVTPLKLGDITIRNGTTASTTFAQMELDIYEAMNSSLNRNKLVYFLLREGPLYSDTLVSKTEFTFIKEAAPTGTTNRRQVKLSFPLTFKPGEERVFGFWIENLKYVISGSLEIKLFDFHMIAGSPTGNFRFLLTR